MSDIFVFKINGGELGIRTLGPFWGHEISSFAPSTTRTTLRIKISVIFNMKIKYKHNKQ